MLAAALLPWWPNAPPPSDSVRKVTDPASEVKKRILALGDREEAKRLCNYKISLVLIIYTNSQCTYSDLTTNTGAMEQTEYINISSFQLRFSIDCNQING